MATIGASVASTLSGVLKDVYLGNVVEQLNNEVLITSRIGRETQEFSGNQAVLSVHKQRSSGVMARGENVQFANPGAQLYAKPVYDIKALYGRLRLTGLGRVKTATQAGAFVKVLDGEVNGLRNDLKMDLARQLYGDGTARICSGAAAAATTITLKDLSGATTISEPLRKGEIYVGMRIDIGTLANPVVVAGGLDVTDVSIANSTITVSGGNITVTAGTHFIFREGNAAASSVSYEINGLKAVIPTAANTFGGIDSTAAGNSYWDIAGRTNVAGALSLDQLTQAFNSVTVAGGDVSAMIASPGIQRALFNLLQPQVRYVSDITSIKGGFTAVEYMGQPFFADRQAPFGTVFLMDESHLKMFDVGEWDWLNEDGNILKWVVGYDAWEAVLAKYCNLGVDRRNVFFLLYGLTDDPNGV